MARRKVAARRGLDQQVGACSRAESLERRVMLAASQVELFDAKPAVFVENMGQWSDASVYYAYTSANASIAFGNDGLRLHLTQSVGTVADVIGSAGGLADPMAAPLAEMQSTSVSMQFVGANPVTPQGEQKADGVYNYSIGDQANWRSNVPGYQTVIYDNLYDGVTLKTFGQKRSMKYEFHVAPGADYQQVQIRCQGIEGLSVANDGSLHIQTALGEMVDEAPVIYQQIAGQRVEVAGGFVLVDDSTYAFEVTGTWDLRYELVLDPELVWSSYLGSSATEFGYDIAIDGDGNAWVSGETTGSSWVSGGFDTSFNGSWDAFVAKINANGTLAWTSYLGGSDYDSGEAIAIDGEGNAWVTGDTRSSGWVIGGFDTTFNDVVGHTFPRDAYVAKINGSGMLEWSSYLGGTSWDYGLGIAIDGSGNAWVTGATTSPGWVSGGFDTSYNGGYDNWAGDAYVAKINANGTLAWSSYLGGSSDDLGQVIAIDASGNAWVTGWTKSSGWVSGGFDTVRGGTQDAFVVKINANGTLAWSSYMGGDNDDLGNGIAIDSGGNATVVGNTTSSGWVNGAFGSIYNGGQDGFVARVNANGALAWSAYMGGAGADGCNAVATDVNGNAWIIGGTYSSGWTAGGSDTSFNGIRDAFVAKVAANGVLAWSGYLGGSDDDDGLGISVSGYGEAWVTGVTSSAGWASGGFDVSQNGGSDAFVARISDVTNHGPTDILLSSTTVPENRPIGTVVGGFSTTDLDAGDTFGYLLVAGAGSSDNASFTISGNQLKTAVGFDFESKSSYSVRVRTTDAGGLPFEKAFTITVTNVNETPTDLILTPSSIAEGQAVGTVVGNFGTVDPDVGDTFTYSLVAGSGSTDNASFTTSGNQLKTAATFDYGTQNSYSIRVRTVDAGGLSFEKAFTISVTPVASNQAPTGITVSVTSIAENALAGTTVGTLITTDPDAGDTFTYSLAAGTGSTDNVSFQIVANQLQTAASFDFETKSNYSIRVRTTDAGGLWYEKAFTITVTNVDEVPTNLTLAATSIAEGQPVGTVIGNFGTVDPDGGNTFTYMLAAGIDGTDNASFIISGDQLKTAGSFDYEAKSSYSIRVRTTDQGGLAFEKTFTINVTDVSETTNSAPTGITLNNALVAENQLAAAMVGTLSSTDPDVGDSFSYSLVGGIGSTGNAGFTIVGNQLKTSSRFDYESRNSYSIRVRTTDVGGLSYEMPFTITVTDDPADLRGQFGLINGKTVASAPLQDANGDLITIKLTGGGSGKVYGYGNTFEDIVLTGTSSRSVLTISVKKSFGGDGRVTIGNITSDGLIKNISGTAVSLSGQVLLNTLNRDPGKAAVSLKLRQINDSDIRVQGMPVASIAVGGTVSDSRIIASGSIGKFTAVALLHSDILVGVATDFSGLFAGHSDFTNTAAKLGSLTVAGKKLPKGSSYPAYVSGVHLSAPSIGTLKLANVDSTVQANVLSDTGTLTITAMNPLTSGVSVLTAGTWKAGKAGRPAVIAVV